MDIWEGIKINILKFLRGKLVPPRTPVTPAEVKAVVGNKDNSELFRTYGITNDALRQVIADQNLIIYERSSIYQVVDRSLCFTGDTKVALLDGRDIEIKQLVEEFNQGKVNYVYSIDNVGRRLVRSPIKWVGKTGTKEIIKVVLDDGSEIKCTPNHLFMLRDGSYKEAKDLQHDESLMPLYRYIDNYKRKGYWRIYNPFNQHINKEKEYCVQYLYFNKDRPKGTIVHHAFKNFYDFNQNKLDDTPDNHQIITKSEHNSIHADLHPKQSWMIILKTTNYAKYLEWCRNISISRIAKKIPTWQTGLTKETDERLSKLSKKMTGVKYPEERTFNSVVTQLQNKRGISREEAIKIYQFNRTNILCPICGKLMDPHRKTCSYECKYEKQRIDKITPWNKGLKNHKVKEIIQLDVVEDVYDLTVEPYHNFALTAGVFVHNCHALMSAACVAFADCATIRSPLHGSTVWVTSDNKEYRYQLEKMLDVINIEEVIYDWAWTCAAFGDMFVEIFGEPGVGIVCVNDDNHPINVSRVDHNGRLVGFFQTPLGYATSDTRKLLAPWDQVHFRLLGAKKRRPLYQDQQYSEFRTISIMTPDARRLTSKYGTSILADALPVWKRLRLAEDSIMIARIMKSPQRFLFKVVIPDDNSNAEAVANLVDQYQAEIKRCLVGDTKIALLNNTNPTIREMAENKEKYIGKYVYSINPITKAIEPDKIVDVVKTVVDATVMRVHLDNEEYVDCTPDHRFMMRDGSFKEAKDLTRGYSLMPLYMRINDERRRKVFNPKTGKFSLVYKLVSECIDGKTPTDCVVHHENENKLDDDPSNLKIVTKHDHMSIHHLFKDKIITKHGTNEAWNKGLTKETDERVAKYAKTVGEVQRDLYALGLKKVWNKGLTKEEDPRMRIISEKVKESNPMGRPEVRANASKSKMGNHNKPRVLRETRICQCGCDGTFECKSNSEQTYIHNHHRKNKRNSLDHNQKIAFAHSKHEHAVVNHKVVRVEVLPYTIDTYDISTEKNHNFALSCGIFVHNSRALNLDSTAPNYLDRFNAMAGAEDLIFPVWGDANNLTVETLGGETDIRWIADVNKLEDQLITALKVPKQLLAGFSGEGGGGFEGGTALERMDIRFSRQARRVQRSIISGLTRMAQIHLAYQGMDPDLSLFQIHMAETSSAEEVELQDSLGKSVDATRAFYDMLVEMIGVDLDKKTLVKYMNEKFWKLSDLDIETLYLEGDAAALQPDQRDMPVAGVEGPGAGEEIPPEEGEAPPETPEVGAEEAPAGAPAAPNPFRENLSISDLKSPLPCHKSGQIWESTWKDIPINIINTPLNEGSK